MTHIYFAHDIGRFDKDFILRVVSGGCRARPSWPSAKNICPCGRPQTSSYLNYYGRPLTLPSRTLQSDCIRLYFLSEAASTSLRSLRENKKPASAAWGKASDLRLGWVGIPLVCVDREQPWLQATSANVGVGFIPIHQAQQRLTASERLVLRNPRLSERSECSLLVRRCEMLTQCLGEVHTRRRALSFKSKLYFMGIT